MKTDIKWHLAQINIAKLKAPIDDPLLAVFVANLDRVNRAADMADGFVWRQPDDTNSATGFQNFGPNHIINMSVWQDVRSLRRYVASEPHRSIMMQKQTWFHLMDSPHLALWWVPAGHLPTHEEADARLQLLADQGAHAQAFTFSKVFPQPETDQPADKT